MVDRLLFAVVYVMYMARSLPEWIHAAPHARMICTAVLSTVSVS